MDHAIETNNLIKNYPTVRALNGITLQVEGGEIFGFLGPNGAGKTTLVKILLGLVIPTLGSVRIFGRDISDHRVRAKVGYVPENPSYQGFLSAEEFLDFNYKLYGLDKAIIKNKINDSFATVGLETDRKRRLKEFSKGMIQRLMLAQALIGDPDLYLLDEPTSGLDPIGQSDILSLVNQLRERGKTVFFNSHVLSEVEQIADRVAIINKGNLLKVGKVKELLTVKEVVVVEVSKITEEFRKRLNEFGEVKVLDSSRAEVAGTQPDIMEKVPLLVRECKLELTGISKKKERLSDYFQKLVFRGG